MEFEQGEQKPRRQPLLRSRGKALAGIAAVLMVGLVGLCVWSRKPPKRREFISPVAPTTEYRFRLTVGEGWKILKQQSAWEINDTMYIAPPDPTPVEKWMADHLLPRPKRIHIPSIMLTVQHPLSQNEMPLQHGYPSVSAPGSLSLRHLLIDGCPTTVDTIQLPDQGPAYRGTVLIAYTPDRELKYTLLAASYMAGDQTDHEMQNIIHSFHIQKVPGPDSKK